MLKSGVKRDQMPPQVMAAKPRYGNSTHLGTENVHADINFAWNAF